MLAIVTDLRLPLVDLYPAFRAEQDPLAFFPFRQFGHYNEQGHRFVGDFLRNAVRALVREKTHDERLKHFHESPNG